MRWHVSVDEGSPLVVIFGAPGRFLARPFRGTIGREMALGLRSLELPSCGREVRPGWRVELPERWHERNNAADRKLLVFRSPRSGETVLEFFQPMAPELVEAIVNAFVKEGVVRHGEEERRASEAQREAVSLAGGEVAAGSGERGSGGDAPAEQDHPEGEPLNEAKAELPGWLGRIVARRQRRGRRRR